MSLKDTLFSIKQTINCRGTLIDFATPRIMGILNITPDSFFDGGVYQREEDILSRVEQMLSEGADIIDVGGCSSRPGAADVSLTEEMARVQTALGTIRKHFPGALISIDTFRAEIAEYGVKEFGVGIINDISAGLLDEKMFALAGSLHVAYIMMHMKGTPQNMQINPQYGDIVKDLLAFFAGRIAVAKESGIHDIIVDPGFGFGKTVADNYELLNQLKVFEILGYPVLVGLSRKSMIYKSLGITPAEALNGTTVLNTLALKNGAKILRVHDVKEAVQTVKLLTVYQNSRKFIDFLLYF